MKSLPGRLGHGRSVFTRLREVEKPAPPFGLRTKAQVFLALGGASSDGFGRLLNLIVL